MKIKKVVNTDNGQRTEEDNTNLVTTSWDEDPPFSLILPPPPNNNEVIHSRAGSIWSITPVPDCCRRIPVWFYQNRGLILSEPVHQWYKENEK